jgi:hypothetical protein
MKAFYQDPMVRPSRTNGVPSVSDGSDKQAFPQNLIHGGVPMGHGSGFKSYINQGITL